MSSPAPSDPSSRKPTHRADAATHEPTEPLGAQRAPQATNADAEPKTQESPQTPQASASDPQPAAAALPDFAGPTAAERELSALHREVLGADTTRMSAADAAEFVAEVGREHRNNLIAITLVLAAPAFLFATLWWPVGVSPAASFGEANPTVATVAGLSIALAVIVLGVVAHFAPRGRHDILERVDRGALVPSDDSVEHGSQLRSASRSRMLVCRILGGVCALAGLVCVVLALSALGAPAPVFGYLALTFVAIAASFAFFYVPFTLRRTARQLGA